MPELSYKEKLARLRLFRTENVGPITFYKLLDRFGSAETALAVLPELSKRGGRAAPLKPPATDIIAKELDNIDKIGAKLIVTGEAEYPPLLAEIEDAPPALTIKGHAHLLAKPALGVVGARNASTNGRKIASDFSRKIGQTGTMIVSGLARGIDTAAHLAALETGTVAVVAGGIDVIYPKENENLYHEICERGAIVAESPFGTEPLARHFPKRNRIISGLSLGVLIVEAALKSGSLITARMALEQNREVMAVPGSPLDPRAEGCNKLIKDGAHVATSAEDIIHVLRGLHLHPFSDKAGDKWQGQPPLPLPPVDAADYKTLRLRLLESLSPVPTPIDDIIRDLEAAPGDILTIILELEMAGRLERQSGNKVNLI